MFGTLRENQIMMTTVYFSTDRPITPSCFILIPFGNSESLCSALRCPGQGRGRKRKTWDFARIKSLNQEGTRTENFQRMKPLAKPDFVDYYVHHAPSYESDLTKSVFLM